MPVIVEGKCSGCALCVSACGPACLGLLNALAVLIDADAMLERGVHPIGKIREAMGALGPGKVVVLRSSFRPEPLIEAMRRAGAAVHSSTQGATHVTCFGRQKK
jgi:hypothetical protein